MLSSECRKGAQACRHLVGAGPDDWWEFEETEIKGRSSQLEAEKSIDESGGFGLGCYQRTFPWSAREERDPICGFRLSESLRSRSRVPSRKLDPTGL